MRWLALGSLALGLGCTDGEATPTPTPTGDSGTTSTYVPQGNDVSLDRFPPVVIATIPPSGSVGVDVATDRLEVVFSKAMRDGSWSWVTTGLPTPAGDASYASASVHVMENVVLDADTTYLAWLNYDGFENFVDIEGRAAVSYPFAFTTTSDPAELASVPAAVVRSSILAGAVNVDPETTRIEIDFSKAMTSGGILLEDDGARTALPILDQGLVDVDTVFIDVELVPEATYAVWITVTDVNGIDSAPWLLTFRTTP